MTNPSGIQIRGTIRHLRSHGSFEAAAGSWLFARQVCVIVSLCDESMVLLESRIVRQACGHRYDQGLCRVSEGQFPASGLSGATSV